MVWPDKPIAELVSNKQTDASTILEMEIMISDLEVTITHRAMTHSEPILSEINLLPADTKQTKEKKNKIKVWNTFFTFEKFECEIIS